MHWLNGWVDQCLIRYWDCQTCSCLIRSGKLFSSSLMKTFLFHMSFFVKVLMGISGSINFFSICNSRTFCSPAIVAINTCSRCLWMCWLLSERGTSDSKNTQSLTLSLVHIRNHSLFQNPTTTNFTLRCIILFLGVYNSFEGRTPPTFFHLNTWSL